MKYYLYFREFLARLHKEEDGASAIEYAIIAGLIAVGIITGATLLGQGIDGMFADIAGRLPGVGGE